MQIYKLKRFARFAKKHKIDDQILIDLIEQAENGLIDANLGGGVIKLRLAKQGQGKSSGYRTIIYYRAGDKAFFSDIFEKNDMENISLEDEIIYKMDAKSYLTQSAEQIQQLIDHHLLFKIQ